MLFTTKHTYSFILIFSYLVSASIIPLYCGAPGFAPPTFTCVHKLRHISHDIWHVQARV